MLPFFGSYICEVCLLGPGIAILVGRWWFLSEQYFWDRIIWFKPPWFGSSVDMVQSPLFGFSILFYLLGGLPWVWNWCYLPYIGDTNFGIGLLRLFAWVGLFFPQKWSVFSTFFREIVVCFWSVFCDFVVW